MNATKPKLDGADFQQIACHLTFPDDESDAVRKEIELVAEKFLLDRKEASLSLTPAGYRDRVTRPGKSARDLAKALRDAAPAYRVAASWLDLSGGRGGERAARIHNNFLDWIDLANSLDRLAEEVATIERHWPKIMGPGTFHARMYGDPKGRLAMDCAQLFARRGDRPKSGRSKFYSFVAEVYEWATGDSLSNEGKGDGLLTATNKVARYYKESEPLEAELRANKERLRQGEIARGEYDAVSRSIADRWPTPPYPLW